MTTKEAQYDLTAMAAANRMANLRRDRLNKILELETTPAQQEALQWARLDFAVAAVRAFRERTRVFNALGTGSLTPRRRTKANAPALAVVQGGRR